MRHNPNKYTSNWFRAEYRSLPPIALLVIVTTTVFLYLFTPKIQLESSRPAPSGIIAVRPALFAYPVSLPEANAACSNKCTIQVCVRWIPGPSPECPRPGPGGGCCTDYEDQCDPGCTDPDPLQPPVISAGQSCAQDGSGGWCTGALTLDLSASDPQGQTVLISGDVSGTPFACANGATTCSVSLPEGNGTVNYTATSASGLTASGSQSYKRDGTAPQIDGSLSGTSGENGWYVSNVDVSASASDAASGVASFQYSLNGGAWTTYSSALTLSDGEHSLELRAVDAAGNQSETSESVRIDRITPLLDLSITGAAGENGWYVSDVQITASATDAGSGLDALEYSADGGAWTDYSSAIVLSDGAHTLSVRAVDAAGNEAQTDRDINVDTLTPLIHLSITGASGAGGWYASDIEVSATASDATPALSGVEASGLDALEYSVDDGAWTAYSGALSYSDGQYSLQFRAVDNAGNETVAPAQTYRVDELPPSIDLPAEWNLGETAEYEVTDYASGVASVRIVIEDDLERFPKLSWYAEPRERIAWDGRFKDGTLAPEGDYYLTIKALDRAGNESTRTARIAVEHNLFTFLLPPFEPPDEPPLPVGDREASRSVAEGGGGEGDAPSTTFGGESNPNDAQLQTGLFSGGGETTVSGASGIASFSTRTLNSSTAGAAPNPEVFWGASASAAIGAFAAEILRKKREAEAAQAAAVKRKGQADRGPRGLKQIAHVYQASLNNYKARLLAQGISVDQANALKAQAVRRGVIPSPLGMASNSGRDKDRAVAAKIANADERHAVLAAAPRPAEPRASAKPKSGKGRGLAAPALDDPEPPSLFGAIAAALKSWWEGIFGAPKPPSQAALPTAQAAITHAPTSTPMPTPTSTPTPIFTPTPILRAYITSPNVNFRTEPDVSAGNIISKLACGTSLEMTGESKLDDEYKWQKVIVGGQQGWVVEDFIDEKNQACPNFAAKYATYPGAGESLVFSELPFRAGSLNYWWGFGNTTNAERLRCDAYESTGGWHNGLDFSPPEGTPLIWSANVPGTVIVTDNSPISYGAGPNNIVIQADNFVVLYGENSNETPLLAVGDQVAPGDLVGYSGEHLHFEIRPAPQIGETKSKIYINPLTFLSPELQKSWFDLFAGDYAPESGQDPLSLGYYTWFPSGCP